MPVKRKDPAAVAHGRKGGKKGGPARAAKMTPEQRSKSARNAVQARWAKVKQPSSGASNLSDRARLALLKRLTETNDPAEVRRISGELERVIFHRQYNNA